MSAQIFDAATKDLCYATSGRAFTIEWTEANTLDLIPDLVEKDHGRPNYAVLHARVEGRPVVTVLGSHKDELVDSSTGERFRTVTPASGKFLAALCQVCVSFNVDMQNGGAKTGYMGAASEYFVAARTAFGSENTTSQLILQPLHFLRHDSNEPPSPLGSDGFVSIPHGAFLTRTGGMYGIGDPVMTTIFVGGIGLGEEYFLGPAAATTGDRCFGPYHRRRTPEFFFVANDTLEGRVPDGYFAGYRKFTETQTELGLLKPSIARRFYFSNLGDPEEEAALVAPWINKPELPRASISHEASRKEATARRVLLEASQRGAEVRRSLEESLEGEGPSFLPVFLSHVYGEYLARQAERAPEDLAGTAVRQLLDESIGKFNALCNFLIDTAQRPTVQLVGFNKDLAPKHAQLQRWFQTFANTLASGSAERNFDFMVTGDGRNGIQKGTFAHWEDRAGARAGAGKRVQSRYVRVQMDMEKEVTDALRGNSGLGETLLPEMCSLESAAALVSLVGRPKVYVVCCPGPVEMYREVLATLLYRQLSKLVLNGFMDCKELPRVYFVSPESNSMEGCWFDGLRTQFQTYERFGATYPGNFDGVHYMKYGRDENLASATIAARSILRAVEPGLSQPHYERAA